MTSIMEEGFRSPRTRVRGSDCRGKHLPRGLASRGYEWSQRVATHPYEIPSPDRARCSHTLLVSMSRKTKRQTRIGISGWTYGPWRGVFYPKDLPQKRELEFASRKFNSIEINGSFYSLQLPSSFQAWYEATPEDIVFSIKGGRFITHSKKM